ncbi:MAG: hypothetical protein AAF802_16580 [Planctomycetota bacterium]
MFSKPKPNLPDAEKSRVEFHLQQIAECVGFERFLLPVLSRQSVIGLFESDQNPQQIIAFLGDHLTHDVSGLQARIIPQQAQGSCGCGGGSCSGPDGLKGRYDAQERTIILDLEIQSDPQMGLATLINGVVCDLLHASDFGSAHLPERVDLAVVGMGLGMVRNNVNLVRRQPSHWDSTQWDSVPRPFLDSRSLAYANAIAAWARDDTTPEWASDLPAELKRPMRKSVKYLSKTRDAFFNPKAKRLQTTQSQSEWWKLASSDSASKQVIAMRHLEMGRQLDKQQESLMLEKLRSANVAIVLHAIAAIDRMHDEMLPASSESFSTELLRLVDHRNDEVRAKAMCALGRFGHLVEAAVESAATMLQDNRRHLVFAGVSALSKLDTVPEDVVPLFDRCFVRALRACDYEFIDLFVASYRRWLDHPQGHLEGLLQDSPEHLPIALEALQKINDQLVQIRIGA